jgi:putative 4-hydroxybenzoate polyprenyltransferase
MGFNRIVDRRIDADNPRTAARELPAGLLSLRAAWLLTVLSALAFVFAAWSLGPVPLYLSPICLLVILGYSLFKRFSWSAHLVLGLALALAPGGAWVAITGSLADLATPLWLMLAVACWVAGFDILYSLQDESFDRARGLHSIPVRFGVRGALRLSALLHLVTVAALVAVHVHAGLGALARPRPRPHRRHPRVRARDRLPRRTSARIDRAFFDLNGYVSLAYLACVRPQPRHHPGLLPQVRRQRPARARPRRLHRHRRPRLQAPRRLVSPPCPDRSPTCSRPTAPRSPTTLRRVCAPAPPACSAPAAPRASCPRSPPCSSPCAATSRPAAPTSCAASSRPRSRSSATTRPATATCGSSARPCAPTSTPASSSAASTPPRSRPGASNSRSSSACCRSTSARRSSSSKPPRSRSSSPSSASSAALVGELREEVREARQLGQYSLLSKLGEGGMGVVYRARHALMRRPTAVKLLPPGRSRKEDLQRFEREVRLTARLSHPNTVTIYDFGRTPEGVFYYAMELLEGGTLEDIVAVGGPLTPARVAKILVAITGALSEAHGIGLIHRDIKPANIMLCEQGGEHDVAKILDFGLVKELGDVGAALSQDSHITGTPYYMAPEAILDPQHLDARADLYALGAVGYFLLTARTVFEGRSSIEVLSHHLHSKPVPPSQRLGAPVPADLEAVILQCLAKTPDGRPSSAAVLRKQLAACADLGGWDLEDARAWWDRHAAQVQARRRDQRGEDDRRGGARPLVMP